MLSRFHRIPERNRQTDGRMDRQTERQSELLYQIARQLVMKMSFLDKSITVRVLTLSCKSLTDRLWRICHELSAGASPSVVVHSFHMLVLDIKCRYVKWEWPICSVNKYCFMTRHNFAINRRSTRTIRLQTLINQTTGHWQVFLFSNLTYLVQLLHLLRPKYHKFSLKLPIFTARRLCIVRTMQW